LISRVQEYRQKAECCEGLALQAKDAKVKIALREAARQWRERANLLAHNVEDPDNPALTRVERWERRELRRHGAGLEVEQ
jgi:hypothetical protein